MVAGRRGCSNSRLRDVGAVRADKGGSVRGLVPGLSDHRKSSVGMVLQEKSSPRTAAGLVTKKSLCRGLVVGAAMLCGARALIGERRQFSVCPSQSGDKRAQMLFAFRGALSPTITDVIQHCQRTVLWRYFGALFFNSASFHPRIQLVSRCVVNNHKFKHACWIVTDPPSL